MDGWGVRPYNWEFSAGVQQELAPRLSASFGYFRRVYGNFFVQDNENLAKTDFTQYSVIVPTDPRLPNSGQTVTGLFDQNIDRGAAERHQGRVATSASSSSTGTASTCRSTRGCGTACSCRAASAPARR